MKKFMMGLTSDERAAIVAGMKEVEREGLSVARHLRGDIYEVKADTDDRFFRILFATEGAYSQVLLALDGFPKTSKKTPHEKIKLAQARLTDWRKRGAARKKEARLGNRKQKGP